MKSYMKKDGYVLLITMAVTLILVMIVVTMLTVVYRYSNTISRDLEELRQIVNPS